jgi:hypothetical protein
MTGDRLPLADLLAKAGDGGFLRSVAKAEWQRGLRLNSIATAVGKVIGVARSLDPDRPDWRPCFVVLDRIRLHVRRLRPGPRRLVHGAALYALGFKLMGRQRTIMRTASPTRRLGRTG